ncbi:MAG: hypothetical protein H7329_13370 [Opitutaceae bacterium]|nr:hypothetical protein [Cytophagales bacterium]
MQDASILKLISSRLEGTESEDESSKLQVWLNQSLENQILYEKTKYLWLNNESLTLTLSQRFNKKYIAKGLFQETIGSLVGFAIGMWVSNSFTHYVKEKRNLKNLYGVLGRKEVVVNEIPAWMQFCLSVILGFIVLEIINYFFQSKSHIKIWNYISISLKRFEK